MEICRQDGGVLRLQGDLHISDGEELRSALLSELSTAPVLTLDLADVERCDAASLQVMCSLKKSAEREGKGLRVVSASAAIQDAGEILGLSMDDFTNIAKN
jgi:anti-anti-sigma factor